MMVENNGEVKLNDISIDVLNLREIEISFEMIY